MPTRIAERATFDTFMCRGLREARCMDDDVELPYRAGVQPCQTIRKPRWDSNPGRTR
jgi:hypothetical protein